MIIPSMPTQSSDKWNEEMKETINQIFSKHAELKSAYEISEFMEKICLFEE